MKKLLTTMTNPRDTASFILEKWGDKLTSNERKLLQRLKIHEDVLLEPHEMQGLFGYEITLSVAHYCRVVFEGTKVKKNIRLYPYKYYDEADYHDDLDIERDNE